MQVNKTIVLTKDEVNKILAKFIEKKAKNTVEIIKDCTDGGLEFHLTPTTFDEAGD